MQLQNLAIGHVSGIIAAAVFLVQLFFPTVFPVILLGMLQEKDVTITTSAVTWSVVGRFLHSSYWPTFLCTDSAATRGVRKSVTVISWLQLLATILVAVAAIVTPLGLYEAITPDKTPTQLMFHYINDKSPFGYGTSPRIGLRWSRICGGWDPVACPNSTNNITRFSNATGSYWEADWYDSHVSKDVIDLFQSGLSTMNRSVSSLFDIQSRSYTWSQVNDNEGALMPDNGTAYPVSAYRQVSSLILTDAIQPIEGLIVDMKNGGIGFRNHSAPPFQPFGSTWTEDILFIQPVTECVNTNLTIDFSVPNNSSQSAERISQMVLTDRGGFVNLIQKYPTWDPNDVQNEPELFLRAYKGAWINNAWTMLWMNITNRRNESDSNSRSFSYLNSTFGKTFPLQRNGHHPSITIQPDALEISTLYGYYLEGTDLEVPGSNSSLFNFTLPGRNSTRSPKPPLYPNPFRINTSNFSVAGSLCRGSSGGDYANSTSLAAQCGLLYGAPQRQDGSASLILDPGSSWTVPIYSCVSVTQALFKTVSFRFNGSDDLSGLTITNLVDKVYPNEASKPLWGVENTELPLVDVRPLWGLVASEQQGRAGLSTLRKESLWLPGYVSSEPSSDGYQNLPGVNFHTEALTAAYSVTSLVSGMDYSGKSNLALYRLWRDLSRTTASATKIMNLIWTDVAANSVVGTKSMEASKGSEGVPDTTTKVNDAEVIMYHQRIKFHLPYGIPAFLVVFSTLCAFLVTSIFVILGRVSPSKIRKYLNETSVGRLLTSMNPDMAPARDNRRPMGSKEESTKAWIDKFGRKEITLGSERRPMAAENASEESGEKADGSTCMETTPQVEPSLHESRNTSNQLG